jgi:hypothetical protein
LLYSFFSGFIEKLAGDCFSNKGKTISKCITKAYTDFEGVYRGVQKVLKDKSMWAMAGLLKDVYDILRECDIFTCGIMDILKGKAY